MESSRPFRLLRSNLGRIIISTIGIIFFSILITWLFIHFGWITTSNQLWIISAIFILSCGSLGTTVYFFIARQNRRHILEINQHIENLLSQINLEQTSDALSEYPDVSRSIRDVKARLESYAQTLESISAGNLSAEQCFRNSNEMIPTQINRLTDNLKTTFGKADDSAIQIQTNSNLVSMSSLDADKAVSAVSTSIHLLANNTEEQTKSVRQTAESIEQLTRAIQGVAEGAQDQATAVAKAAQITSMMTETIRVVSESIKAAAKKSDDASNTARKGTDTVEQTVNGMRQIKQKVDETAQKIILMAEHSEKIGEIVGTIDDISSQTNLLALNAAIEAARAESQAEALIEFLLNKQMVSQAQLVNQVLLDKSDRPPSFWSELAKQSGLDVISVANEDGVNVYSSDERLVGFRYSDDPKEQSFAFRKMIQDKSGPVCQPPKKRNIDGMLYKYIGVFRKDKPGAIQVGFNAESLSSFKLQVGGFAVVANEVYRLAESSKESAREISRLVREMQKRMDEVKTAMQMSTLEVERGFTNADDANKALLAIVDSTNEVTRESVQAAEEADKMTSYADDLVSSVDSVSAVVEENTATTEEMAAHSNELNLAMGSIAAVSELNSDAIREAITSLDDVQRTNEMINSQTQALQKTTAELLQTIHYFKVTEK